MLDDATENAGQPNTLLSGHQIVRREDILHWQAWSGMIYLAVGAAQSYATMASEPRWRYGLYRGRLSIFRGTACTVRRARRIEKYPNHRDRSAFL